MRLLQLTIHFLSAARRLVSARPMHHAGGRSVVSNDSNIAVFHPIRWSLLALPFLVVRVWRPRDQREWERRS